jgi:hypothetical protein
MKTHPNFRSFGSAHALTVRTAQDKTPAVIGASALPCKNPS